MRKVVVRVKPGSKHARIDASAADGSLAVHLQSPPVDGRANQELIERLARHFGLPKAAIRIKTGAGARIKIVELAD